MKYFFTAIMYTLLSLTVLPTYAWGNEPAVLTPIHKKSPDTAQVPIPQQIPPTTRTKANTRCQLRKQMLKFIRRHGEKQIAVAGIGDQQFIEWFVSPTGSWTVTALNPQGIMCIVVSGTEFWANAKALPAVEGFSQTVSK